MTRRIQITLTVVLLAAAAFIGWQRLSTAAAPNAVCDIECRLRRELDLSRGQEAEIAAILASKQPEMERMFAAYEPRMQDARNAARQKLAQVLTAAQLDRFEEFLQEMRRKRLSELSMKSALLPYCKGPRAAGQAGAGQTKGQSRIDRLMLRLALTPQQEQPVRAILTELRDAVVPIKRELKEKTVPLQQETTRAVEVLLTPAQQKRLAKLAHPASSLCGEPQP